MILIVDFGSQYTQLIARRIREHNVYCEIVPCTVDVHTLAGKDIEGIILSGGPSSVYEKNSPRCDTQLFDLCVPVLGICYGMQLLVHHFGGHVARAPKREYGLAHLSIIKRNPLFDGLTKTQTVWMSHGDACVRLPKGWAVIGKTRDVPHAVVHYNHIYGVQFHPEVVHTEHGTAIVNNFLTICNAKRNWTMKSFIKTQVDEIRARVGKQNVIGALSGGVDSSVMAGLIHQAIGTQLTCVFVDNGLLRLNERTKVETLFRKKMRLNLIVVDARKSFLDKLSGIADPEKKRKIIGHEFIAVFEKTARKISGIHFLAQGTLYPDVIESVSVKGPSATIKSHHNVGGLPKKMKLSLIEPLRFLFKDEVRVLGKTLGLPDEIIHRQPFPGPGLAVRILGDITEERITILQHADAIVVEEVKLAGWYLKMWQSFAVLLPIKTVGVMGDQRTYEHVIALRAVHSVDGMTADWVKLPYELLGKISNRIINEVKGVNRVVYDISSKPPATIEWE